MGGQACVLYGAAEFSRDTDFAILASPENLRRLGSALEELHGEVIAVPPFQAEYLERGHAVHFRCHHPEADRVRIDVMAKLRGVDPFPALWDRRSTWTLPEGIEIDTLSLPDLVASKKTQRDKDWPMVRRLLEVSYEEGFASPTPEQVRFWLRELRTPEALLEVVDRHPQEARAEAPSRSAIKAALDGELRTVEEHVAEEERRERAADQAYWQPLLAELEALRRCR